MFDCKFWFHTVKLAISLNLSCPNNCNSLLYHLPASSVHSLHRIYNCAAHFKYWKDVKLSDCIFYSSISISTGSQSHKEFSTGKTPSAINVLCALLCLISVSVFNFTHPPVLSTLLLNLFDSLTVSASRFLIILDFPLLVPEPVLSSAPVHGMTFPFLSDKNAPRTPSYQT